MEAFLKWLWYWDLQNKARQSPAALLLVVFEAAVSNDWIVTFFLFLLEI